MACGLEEPSQGVKTVTPIPWVLFVYEGGTNMVRYPDPVDVFILMYFVLYLHRNNLVNSNLCPLRKLPATKQAERVQIKFSISQALCKDNCAKGMELLATEKNQESMVAYGCIYCMGYFELSRVHLPTTCWEFSMSSLRLHPGFADAHPGFADAHPSFADAFYSKPTGLQGPYVEELTRFHVFCCWGQRNQFERVSSVCGCVFVWRLVWWWSG